ncbi:putative toxin-antitoxin system toxin component, PIN family [Desulfoscipio gibsoniae]|uniref:Putative toxin-antitoxin system toxin component, PIN family n=1 Tax=Desulfoscipio gibsoniae DSM 7213 TaxID=767817 RepID=R4KQG4_9FIRM|nr:putative toxin-antitoxin system toxin component, PIN family [Desulfoscipio gibsoniae]AGL01881.1 putative toxin-antitoxin system toxin component, PIN family [Desulfoscipio gibsoniae DSM 7213]
MKRNNIFLDSSVIIAGLASKKGGSYEVLVLAELNIIIPCICENVVSEVYRNVQKKLPAGLVHVYSLFKNLPFKLIDPTEEDIEKAKKMINEKDAAILAAAITGKVDWLLSLDKHFLELDLGDKIGMKISSPGEFLHKFPF